MADNEDVNTLKRRGRRRLVGAIALVLLAVIVLPMVFDSEPRVTPPPVSVRVPGEDESGFTPKVTPKAPEEKAGETKAAETKAERPPEKVAEKASEKAAEKPAQKPVEKPVVAKKEAEKPAARPAASAAAAEKRANGEGRDVKGMLLDETAEKVDASRRLDPSGVTGSFGCKSAVSEDRHACRERSSAGVL